MKKIPVLLLICLSVMLAGCGASSSNSAPAKQFISGQEYIMDESSVVAKDLSSLTAFYDCVKNSDKAGMKSLVDQDKLYLLPAQAKVIVTAELDKDVCMVQIKSGKHISKDGYTFAKYIHK